MLSKTKNIDNINNTNGNENALVNLKPLNDWARNWDIDISSCLEEYLQELINVGHPISKIQLDSHDKNGKSGRSDNQNLPDKNATNFALAALLLQNSSNVYSRKVEYLYSLVYAAWNETFSQVTANDSNPNKAGNRKSKNGVIDVDIEEFYNFDTNLNFHLLNDVIPVDWKGNKINLPLTSDEDGINYGETTNSNLHDLNQTRISLGQSLYETRFEQSNTFDIQENNRYKQHKNCWSSSTADARRLISALFNEGCQSNDGGNLKLLSGNCDINSDGALLLPGSSIIQSDSPSTMIDSENSGMRYSVGVDISNEPLISTENIPENATSNYGTEEHNESLQPGDDNVDVDNDISIDVVDDDNDGPGFQINENSPSQQIISGENNFDDVKEPQSNQTSICKENCDPWKLVDPHDGSKSKSRPLKIGNTYLLPFDLECPPSDLVTGSRTKRKAQKIHKEKKKGPPNTETAHVGYHAFEEILNKALEVRKRRKSGLLQNSNIFDDDISLVGKELNNEDKISKLSDRLSTKLTFGEEFTYILKADRKRKNDENRKKRKLLMQQQSMSENAVNAQEKFDNIYEDFDEENEGAGHNFVDDNNDNYDDCNVNSHFNGSSAGNVGLVSLGEAFQGSNAIDDHGSMDEDETFESLCRAHINAFAKGAEKYAVETQLSARVTDWQGRLRPILDEESIRPHFDIHEYGSKIINRAKVEIQRKSHEKKGLDHQSKDPSNKVVDFNSITKNCEHYEVCRLFLSSLMLCNSGRISVSHGEKEGQVPTLDDIQVQLLETQISCTMNEENENQYEPISSRSNLTLVHS